MLSNSQCDNILQPRFRRAAGAAVSSVAALLLLALAGPSAADTLVSDIRGYTPTMDGLVRFEALVFDDDGRILATGDTSLGERYPDAVRVEGGGRTVLPGLIDAHAHVLDQALLEAQLDLAGVPSRSEAVARIAAFAERNPRHQWILGRGWNQVIWPEDAFPTASDIDAVVADRPVWLRRIDGHAGWANSAALAIAGIDDDTPDPAGGRILRDARGRATGVLIDAAMSLVEPHVPAPTRTEMRDAYRAVIPRLLSLGLTGVHDAGIGLDEAAVYRTMADEGELDVRIYAMLSGAGETLDGFGPPLRGYADDRLDIASVKLYEDGALGSRGAALIEPYSDDAENRGLLFHPVDSLAAQSEKANRLGFQVGIHAIGDLANRAALDALERVQRGKPSPLRNRIEHAQVIALEDIPRFAELGVIASMQPVHATSDMNMAEDRVGSERIAGAYAWRKLLDSGAIIAAGSDFPVELANPFHGLYAAVTRRDRDGLPEGGWYPGEAMTREEALAAFTLWAAYAAHKESVLGSLEPGKWADFIVVDRDYFEVPASEIHGIRVLEAWLAGERVFGHGDEP